MVESMSINIIVAYIALSSFLLATGKRHEWTGQDKILLDCLPTKDFAPASVITSVTPEHN